MVYENWIYIKEEYIGVLKVNRPKMLNALSISTVKELSAIVDEIAQDSDLRVLVVTGEGGNFAAGADISEMKGLSGAFAKNFAVNGQTAYRKLELLKVPVIAAVCGFALGGGCELAMACDIRIAADNAALGQPEVGLGFPPGFGGTQRLTRLVGPAKAKELIFTGNVITAADAERIGLVNQVVPQDQLMEVVMKMARKISRNAPIAVQQCKKAITRGMDIDMESAQEIESDAAAFCGMSEDILEGVTAFVEKRKPVFKNR
ncbi:MAG: enoyl-CoA hydratase/isomerase family protein [Desulfamplus sp.]|nr:enoyl-CoA hydratase/isomerase family protein [Desulfamplus sp.]